MQRALLLAERAQAADEVPVGAIVVMGGRIIAEGWNQPVGAQDPTAHAEIVALRAAGRAVGNYRLGGATLFVTLEPCAMCLGAMLNARISRVVFGAWDAKAGACGSVIDLPRQMQAGAAIDAFGGVCAEASREMLRSFFAARR
jgi:tRNA(adenine34) deaminase